MARRMMRRTILTAVAVPLARRALQRAAVELRTRGGKNAQYADYLDEAAKLLRRL
ncbi:MAG: hypothetical protein M3Q22_04455 [Actinomycetota bacterium]|nr:hypothetical protein [Actinomycetota bacterium]MDP9459524.1 hypothetical protein [Actinomycetota bacterium]